MILDSGLNAEVETVAAAEGQGTGDWWSQVSFIG